MQPIERFTRRAANYVKYRPGYPGEVVDTLEREAGLTPGAQVVDAGAGTGISSLLFQRRGYRVLAVEPNAEMRAAAESLGVGSCNATAEQTGLPSGFADLVTCAQAFHWVRPEEARDEFLRIVKPGGVIALMWNVRLYEGSPFKSGLDALLKSYGVPADRDTIVDVPRLFAPRAVHERVFRHAQRFDLAGLEGRVLSISYAPLDNAEFVEALRRLFAETNEDGLVTMDYECRLYWLRG